MTLWPAPRASSCHLATAHSASPPQARTPHQLVPRCASIAAQASFRILPALTVAGNAPALILASAALCLHLPWLPLCVYVHIGISGPFYPSLEGPCPSCVSMMPLLIKICISRLRDPLVCPWVCYWPPDSQSAFIDQYLYLAITCLPVNPRPAARALPCHLVAAHSASPPQARMPQQLAPRCASTAAQASFRVLLA